MINTFHRDRDRSNRTVMKFQTAISSLIVVSNRLRLRFWEAVLRGQRACVSTARVARQWNQSLDASPVRRSSLSLSLGLSLCEIRYRGKELDVQMDLARECLRARPRRVASVTIF